MGALASQNNRSRAFLKPLNQPMTVQKPNQNSLYERVKTKLKEDKQYKGFSDFLFKKPKPKEEQISFEQLMKSIIQEENYKSRKQKQSKVTHKTYHDYSRDDMSVRSHILDNATKKYAVRQYINIV